MNPTEVKKGDRVVLRNIEVPGAEASGVVRELVPSRLDSPNIKAGVFLNGFVRMFHWYEWDLIGWTLGPPTTPGYYLLNEAEFVEVLEDGTIGHAGDVHTIYEPSEGDVFERYVPVGDPDELTKRNDRLVAYLRDKVQLPAAEIDRIADGAPEELGF